MRTPPDIVTAGIRDRSFRVSVRVGTLHLDSVDGWDLLRMVDVSDDIDAAHATATVRLGLRAYELSMSPLAADSAINRDFNPTNTPEPLLRPRRPVEIFAAATPVDGTGDLESIFKGFIDEVEIAGDEVTLTCSDELGALRDTFIEQERMYGILGSYSRGIEIFKHLKEYRVGDRVVPKTLNGRVYECSVAGTSQEEALGDSDWNASPVVAGSARFVEIASMESHVELEVVVAQLLADNGFSGLTVEWPAGSPEFGILPYIQQRQSLLEAIRTLVAARGWVVKYRWHAASGTWRMTIYGEDPDDLTPDATIPLEEQHVDSLRWTVEDVRNVVRVGYRDENDLTPMGHARDRWHTAEDPTSIAIFGRRFAELYEGTDSPINSLAEAQNLAGRVLAELIAPGCEINLETPLAYWHELGDYLSIEPGSPIIPDTIQHAAVVGVIHSFSPGVAKTALKLRGLRTSARWLWLRQASGSGSQVPPVREEMLTPPGGYDVTATPATGGVTVKVRSIEPVAGTKLYGFEVHASESAPFAPSSMTLVATITGDSGFVSFPDGTPRHLIVIPLSREGDRIIRGGQTPITLAVPGPVVPSPGTVRQIHYLTPPAENLIPNGYSEAGTIAEGLVPEGDGLHEDPALAFEGRWLRRREISAGTDTLNFTGGVYSDAPGGSIPCAPGDTFVAEVWVRGSASFAGLAGRLFMGWESEGEYVPGSNVSVEVPSLTTTYQRVVVKGTVPAGRSGVQLFWYRSVGSSSDIGKFVCFDAISMRKAITADLIVGNTIQTSNFVPGMSGGTPYAAEGAKLDSQDTALLVHENGMRIGTTYAGAPIVKAHNALDGALGSARGFIVRGNNNTDVRGGAPNIECLSLHLVQLNYRANDNFTYATLELRLTPTSLNDNLDGVNVASIGCYTTSTNGQLNTNVLTWTDPSGFMGLYQAMPSRGYGSETHNLGTNMARTNFPFQATGDRTMRRGTSGWASLVVFYVRIYNVYGGSAGKWFYFDTSGNTAVAVDQIGGSGSDTGGGGGSSGGGGGGFCLDPDSMVDMADLTSKRAGDVRVGDYVLTRGENDGPGLEVFREVTAYSQVWEENRFKLTTTDGRFIIASKGHKMRAYDFSWTPIQDCTPGTELFGSLGHFAPAIVSSVEPAPPGLVCKITVDGTHTLFANGLWQSNAKPL